MRSHNSLVLQHERHSRRTVVDEPATDIDKFLRQQEREWEREGFWITLVKSTHCAKARHTV